MFKKIVLGLVCAITIVSIGSYKGLSEDEKATKLEDKVIVYSNYDKDVLDYIGKEFKESTGVEVEFKDLDTSIKSVEGINDGDILLGGDKNLYETLKKDDKLVYTKPSWYDELSYADKDIEGFWYGASKSAIVPFVNTSNASNKVTIKSWSDLGNLNIKNKLILKDTKNYDTYMMISSIVDQFQAKDNEQAGINLISNIKLNTSKFVKNDTELFEELGNKETPVAVSNLSTIMLENDKNNSNMTPIYPEEGIPIITQCTGILTEAENINAAKVFIEFIAGAKVQLELANDYNIIPTNPVVANYSKEWIKNLSDNNILDLNLSNINKNKDRWIQDFDQVTVEKPSVQEEKTKNNLNNNKKSTSKKSNTTNKAKDNSVNNKQENNKKSNTSNNKDGTYEVDDEYQINGFE